MNALDHPVVKWSGSKRPVARALAALWPPAAPGARYLEPFVGGGSMLAVRPCRAGLAGDVVPELIGLWRAIATRPGEVAAHYEAHWARRRREGPEVYYEVRARFNRERDPLDLLVLSRMCVNGLIRFNAAGEFNNSLHHTRPGIDPARLRAVLAAWAEAIAGVDFAVADFRETLAAARPGDMAFLDPPYVGTRGRYMPGAFDFDALWAELRRLDGLGARWVLTLDGRAGGRAYEERVPADLYRARIALGTGRSPFTRLMGTSLDDVEETVYLNFDPPGPASEGILRPTAADGGT